MPTLWRFANFNLVHKGGNREVVGNFRSISLLPITVKYLERVVHDAIYTHKSPQLDHVCGFL